MTEALITTMKKKVKHRIDVKFEKKQNHVFKSPFRGGVKMESYFLITL
jgi:hypothetical protein